jgi:hypothetical protein
MVKSSQSDRKPPQTENRTLWLAGTGWRLASIAQWEFLGLSHAVAVPPLA